MKPFNIVTGKVVPLDRANVDTDAIIPKQYLKSIHRSGFGPFLFDDWRYLDPGDLDIDPATRRVNPDFVLNQARYDGSTVLLARENFGCGSSREHAVWALSDYGFRAVLAPSFADIFYNNSFKNGFLPLELRGHQIDVIFGEARKEGFALTIDLPAQKVHTPTGLEFRFDIDPFRKDCLVRGLDEIGLTLQQADSIREHEAGLRESSPWLFQ